MASGLPLPTWFLAIDVRNFIASGSFRLEYLGGDARLYAEAAGRWLEGGDPWQLGQEGAFHFAALPTTLFVFAPFTLVPPGLAALAWFAASVVAAWYIVRSLRLPIWWLAFPPLVSGVWIANPDIVMLALLLGPARSIAPLVKVYAVVPLLGERRWRSILGAAVLTMLTVVVAPDVWLYYAQNALTIATRLLTEAAGGFSAWGRPLLLVPAVIGVIRMLRQDSRLAGWASVPALWPASGFHYSTLLMPTMPPAWLGALLAVPIPGLPPIAIAIAAFVAPAVPRRD